MGGWHRQVRVAVVSAIVYTLYLAEQYKGLLSEPLDITPMHLGNQSANLDVETEYLFLGPNHKSMRIMMPSLTQTIFHVSHLRSCWSLGLWSVD